VVAGTSSYDFAVVRYNTNGSLDTSFDGDGMATTDLGTYEDYGYSVAVQSDGRIVVAGRSGSNFAVVRYNANGLLDTSFDGDGKVITSIGPSSESGRAVVSQADGKVVVAGGTDRRSARSRT
jgi:uncharacterized delta-60 repeat protein